MKKTIVILLLLLQMFTCESLINSDKLVIARFTYSTDSELFPAYVNFQNCSENATDYYWDFGDSSDSIEENPSHEYTQDGEFIVSLTASNNSDSDICIDTILVNWTQVKKPNIYLYPQNDLDLSVTLNFPRGGRIIKSIPEYNNGWHVHVDSSGKIDVTFNYLFYEAIQPDIWQYAKGWCIAKDDLNDFFQHNMQTYGFAENEINDFIDYWIPRLTDSNYYIIYPQENQIIDQVIEITFSVQPQQINRLYYAIKATNEYYPIVSPQIAAFNRDGFTVVEWGVILR